MTCPHQKMRVYPLGSNHSYDKLFFVTNGNNKYLHKDD